MGRRDRDLKDDATGTMKLGEPVWSTPWHIGRVSYVELEAKLAQPPGRDQGAGSAQYLDEPDRSPPHDA